jgi:DNA-binding LacI/PurR family transcriptional regulator
MANLRDVAQAAGVSISTASNALRGLRGASALVVERVRAEAARLGYVPDPVWAALRSGRARPRAQRLAMVAYVTHRDNPLELPLGFARRGVELGMRGHLVVASRDSSASGLGEAFARLGCRAVLIAEHPETEHLLCADWPGFAVVGMALPRPSIRQHLVAGVEPAAAVARCMTELHAIGVRRPLLICGPHAPPRWEDALRFWVASGQAGDLGMTLAQTWLAEPPIWREALRNHDADGVIALTPWHYWVLREQGVRLPFVSLHAHPADPMVAGVVADPTRDGERCAEFIDELLRHRRLGTPAMPELRLRSVIWQDAPSMRP